jgi:hypothetical protein
MALTAKAAAAQCGVTAFAVKQPGNDLVLFTWVNLGPGLLR